MRWFSREKLLFLMVFCVFFAGTHGVMAADGKEDNKSAITISIPAEKVEVFKQALLKDNKEEKESTSIIDANLDKLNDFSSLHQTLTNNLGRVIKWFAQEKYSIMALFGGLLLTFIVSMLFNFLFRHVLIKHLASKTDSKLDDMICDCLQKPMTLFIFTVGVFLSSIMLFKHLPKDIFGILFRSFIAVMVASIVWGCYRLISIVNHMLQKISKRSDNNLDDLLVSLIRKAMKVTLVVIAVMFIGQSILGLNITALLAGAGVAGLAVAFAAKDTISNFLGSVMLILDKPFSVGDRIKTAGIEGVVENVGFRSTRMRSLDGHLYSVPNSKVADSVVENISKRPFIKGIFDLTLVYDTPDEKMARAMALLHEILDSREYFDMEELPPRINFTSFNDWALNINVVIWFKTTNYWDSRQWLSDINLEILRRFNAEGLEFAFPTSTQYLAGDPTRLLTVKTKEIKN